MIYMPQINHLTLPSFKVQMEAEMDPDKPNNILQTHLCSASCSYYHICI